MIARLRRRFPRPRPGRLANMEDEARFIDFARSAYWVGKEHVLIDRWY